MRRAIGMVSFGVIALVLVACGSSGPSAAEKREAKERREKAAAVAAAKQCEDQLGGFVEALAELDSRLAVGLSYDEYFDEVGNVRVTYDRIPFNQLKMPCLNQVGLHGEKALNHYVEAATTWDECFGELSCEFDSIDPELQQQWAKAAGQIEQAERGFAAMREP